MRSCCWRFGIWWSRNFEGRYQWENRMSFGQLGQSQGSLWFYSLLEKSVWSKRWTRITTTCYSSVLFGQQRKIHPQVVRAGWPKRWEEKHLAQFWLLFLFYLFIYFLLPLNLPCVNWASQEGCLFYLRPSLQSSNIPLFYFHRLFPFLSFSHCHFGLLFPILTT